MEGVNSCQLCSRVAVTDSVDLKPISSLWVELYHKNVRETLMSSSAEGGRSTGTAPQLTFTFSFLGSSHIHKDCHHDDDNVWLCEACTEEVHQLKILHEQLESCKKRIAAQVERIETVYDGSSSSDAREDGAVANGRKTTPFWKRKLAELRTDVALAGTTVGSGNITTMLRCLGGLCEDIGSSQGNNVNCEPGNTQGVQPVQEITKVEPNSDIELLAPETKPSVPIIVDSIGSHASTKDTNRNVDRLHQPVDTDSEDVGDIFPHIVKMDPEAAATSPEIDIMDASLMDEGLLDPNTPCMDNDPLAQDNQYWSNTSALSNSPCLNPSTSSCPPTKPGKKRKSGGQTPTQTQQRKVPGKLKKSISMTAHMKNSRFECEFCGRKFNNSLHFVEHRRIHTGEKPHACNMCSFRTAQKSNYKRHMETKH